MASHGVPRVTSTEERAQQCPLKEQRQITEYKELVELVESNIRAREYTAEVLAQTSKLLTQNPEYYTIWNHRRLILQHQFSQSPRILADSEAGSDPEDSPTYKLLTSDLYFLVPLLRKFPKCYWIWNHRLWLLQASITFLPTPIARQLHLGEMKLVGKMLALDSRNFHGWDYRRYIVAALESPKLEGQSMAEPEFEYTTKMIQTNLSNFSAWHRRGKLIPRLLDERDATPAARREFLDSEFALILRALYTDPYDQSLWFYHHFLISALTPTLTKTPNAAAIVPDLSPSEILVILDRELANIKELLEDADDCKWLYQALLGYTLLRRHIARDATSEEGGKRDDDTDREREEGDPLKIYLRELHKLDPLRRGRWDDMALKLD